MPKNTKAVGFIDPELGQGLSFSLFDSISTFDFSRMTDIVLYAHKFGVRVEASPAGQRIRLFLSARPKCLDEESCAIRRHPGLYSLIEKAKTLMEDAEHGTV